MTKLNKTRIKWLIRQVVKFNKRPEDVAPVYGITARRVRQLVQSFRRTGKIPEKNKKSSGKKTFARKNWEKTYLKRVGKKATKTVRDALVHGKISTADALDILNVKGKYAEKFLG